MWRKEWRDFHWYIMCGEMVIGCVDGLSDYLVNRIIAEHNKFVEENT